MIPLDAFSPDYKTARSRFREMVARHGWPSEAHAVGAPEFAEGELTIDVARAGRPDARRLLVLSSGLHGGEAPFGAAVQLAWLDSLPHRWEPPCGCAVLLLHVLNPYGFAKMRRANEENVDLNRNFLDSADFARLKESTFREFAPLDRYLNPACPPSQRNWALLIFLQMRLLLGQSILADVLPAGQYAFPQGIFYGGQKPSRSTEIVMGEMPRWLGSARSAVHLDFHTGLGAYGGCRLLLSDHEGSRQETAAKRLFGPELVETDRKTLGGYHNHGDMGEWLSRRFSEQNYLYLCAEFGTYGSIQIIGALRRENQAHHWQNPDSGLYQRIKEDFREAFIPRSPAWRWSVVRRSLELIHSALRNCASLD